MVTIAITFDPADTTHSLYPVQLWHEGKPLVKVKVSLDRQGLIEREPQFDAHHYGMELSDAVFGGALGRAYQRLAGQAGAEGVVRVQLVIHPAASRAERAALGAALPRIRRHGRTPGRLGADAVLPLLDHRLWRPAARPDGSCAC